MNVSRKAFARRSGGGFLGGFGVQLFDRGGLQRAQIDAQRYGPPPADPALAPPPPPPPPGPPVELNGVVVRSSGRSTVWLNQETQNEPHNRLARDKSGMPGTLTLRLSTGQAVRLKPGQRYDPASGTVTEAQEMQQ